MPTLDIDKPNLIGLTLAELEVFVLGLGQPKYRATQIFKWIHQQQIKDFSSMTNIAKSTIAELQNVASIIPLEQMSSHQSEDGTVKWLFDIGGSSVEAVLIPESSRMTLCVSSQAGCTLDCSFCSTGKQGFFRNLNAHEIISQLWYANLHLASQDKKITNVVFMGMGEPLMNYDAVQQAINIMLADQGYGLSKRHITLSTAGVVPMLDRLAQDTDVSLAISLHAANDELRNVLVPLNKKYPIASLLKSAKSYIDALPDRRRRITVEYCIIDNVNNSAQDAKDLARLLQNYPCKVNLIPFNHFAGSSYSTPSMKNIEAFQDILMQAGVFTTIRKTRGEDVIAACGQLAGRIQDRTKRSERYGSLIGVSR